MITTQERWLSIQVQSRKEIILTLLMLTFHFQTEVLSGIKQQKTLQNSIQIHKTQNWKGTGTYIYTDCYSILPYTALRCNVHVLMENISTLFNCILSLPRLSYFLCLHDRAS